MTNLTIDKENIEKFVSDYKRGSLIILNVEDLSNGQTSVGITTLLTGTPEQRKTDNEQLAQAAFAHHLMQLIREKIGELSNEAGINATQEHPPLLRIFQPNLPEKILAVFDKVTNSKEALEAIQEIDGFGEMECNCPGCRSKRAEEEQQDMSDVEKGNVPVH